MKKTIVCLLILVMILTASCGQGKNNVDSNSTSVGKGNYGTINNGKNITLQIDMNTFFPSINEKPTESSPVVFRSMQAIADEFMKIYPNVKIEWDRSKASYGNWAQWMTVRLSANNAPDIVSLYGPKYSDRGWYLPLNDILNEPNVFIKGNKKWKDTFPEYIWNECTDASNTITSVPYVLFPGTSTAYFYNKEIFNKLKLTPPKTWEEFITIGKKINAAGYVAVAPWLLNKKINSDAWDIQFSMGPVYSEFIKDKWDYNKDGVMSTVELLRSTYEGVFNSSNPAVLDIYKQLKRKYKDVLQEGAVNTDYELLWTQGRVAMMEDGLWRLPTEQANTLRKFEYGIFPPPVITKESSQYVSEIKYQKGPSRPAIEESYNLVKDTITRKGEGAKMAAVRFLQYITETDNANQVVLEKHGSCISAVKGTVVPPELKEWFKNEFPILPSAKWPIGSTIETESALSRALEMWVLGVYDDKKFCELYDNELSKGAAEQIKSFKIDTSTWKK